VVWRLPIYPGGPGGCASNPCATLRGSRRAYCRKNTRTAQNYWSGFWATFSIFAYGGPGNGTPGVTPGAAPPASLPPAETPQGEQQNLLDKLKDWICMAPAATASVQGQVDAGLTFDAEAQLALTLTTHGQFIVQYQQGMLWGLNVGAAASVSTQGGVLWNDAPAGASPTSSYVANGFMVDTFGGGGSIQINGDGAQGSWSSPRARAGRTGSAGWGAFVGGGKVEGVQWATVGICGGK
jgi:hypothetical protein